MSPAEDPRSDQELVAAINGGDPSAFDGLYYRYRDWVVRLAMRFTKHQDDALDVLQETFAYLARKFPGLTLTSSMTTFLYPAIRNLSLAARRRRLRSASGDQDLETIPVTSSAAVANDDVSHALRSLSDAHREILLMRFVDDMSLQEIADALGLPLGTVKSRLHHALSSAKELPAFRTDE
jgi:RNA polymerase sigma-70 factor (ECF subfamily)